jgi:hypothetical protein
MEKPDISRDGGAISLRWGMLLHPAWEEAMT